MAKYTIVFAIQGGNGHAIVHSRARGLASAKDDARITLELDYGESARYAHVVAAFSGKIEPIFTNVKTHCM